MTELKNISFYGLTKVKPPQSKRWQKNNTVSKEHLEYIKSKHGKMTIGEISATLGLTYNIVHNNMRVCNLVKPRQAKIINFEKNGYFDIDQFGKLYQV